MAHPFRSLVLCYHAVSDSWPDQLAVRPAALEAQLRALKRRGFRAATAAEAASGRRRLLHVTFDDAFESVANAVPILRRLDLGATVFACSGYGDDGRPLDVPELAGPLATHPEALRTMRWERLRELADNGLAIGSHTVSHPHLTTLPDDELARELRESRTQIEDELEKPCSVLAYPYGEHDERVRAAARRAGYTIAFALRSETRPFDPLALPRVDLYRKDTAFRAAAKTSPIRLLPLGARSHLFPSRPRGESQP